MIFPLLIDETAVVSRVEKLVHRVGDFRRHHPEGIFDRRDATRKFVFKTVLVPHDELSGGNTDKLDGEFVVKRDSRLGLGLDGELEEAVLRRGAVDGRAFNLHRARRLRVERPIRNGRRGIVERLLLGLDEFRTLHVFPTIRIGFEVQGVVGVKRFKFDMAIRNVIQTGVDAIALTGVGDF